jgi:hypothetical protein
VPEPAATGRSRLLAHAAVAAGLTAALLAPAAPAPAAVAAARATAQATARAAVAPGTLDPTFGSGGVFVPPPAAGGGTPGGNRLARGAGGTVWLVGFEGSVYLDRITSAGRQDPTFRQGHPTGGDTGDGSLTLGVVPLPDGGALAGWSLFSVTSADQGVVRRYRPDGLLGAAFTLPLPPLPADAQDGPHFREGLVRTGSGAVRVTAVVGATSGGQVSLVGLTAAGAPDPALGTGGVRRVPGLVDVFQLLQDGSGRLLVVGLSPARTLRVVRTDAAGRVDAGYGTGGAVTFGSLRPVLTGHGTDLRAAVTRAGTLYVGATAPTLAGRSQAAIAKATSGGVPDPAFGTAGVRRYARPQADTTLTGLGLVSGGRLVAGTVSTGGTTPGPALLRFAAADGSPDPAFGAGGWYRTVERTLHVLVDATGRMITTGYRPTAQGTTSAVVTRRLP